MWVPVLLLSSVFEFWCHAMKSLPVCESLCFSSALFLISDLLPWNPFQFVSSCASPQLCLWSLTSCHEIPSSLWVPVLLLSSVSDLWPPAMKCLPGCESLCFSALSLISDLLPWNPFQDVSPCASPQLCLWSLTSSHEIPSSLWVPVLFFLLGLVSDLWLNLIQNVSSCASPQLCFWSLTSCHEILFRMWVPVLLLSSVSDFWSPAMKSLPACESLCFFFSSALSLISDLTHSECKFLCFSSALFLISDLLPWNLLQLVSPCASSQLCLWSLTSHHLPPWNLLQLVSPCVLSSVSDLWPPAMKSLSERESLCLSSALSLISDLLSWNSVQGVSSYASSQLCFWSLTSCHEISSSLWVSVLLLSSVISDLLPWNPVQGVSRCASAQLSFWYPTFHYDIPFSKWVFPLGLVCITDISFSSCVQFVPIYFLHHTLLIGLPL